MQIGAIFPQTEIGQDPAAIRDYAQAVEDLGFSYLLAFDHVLGANIEREDRQGRSWPYNHRTMFHEPFVLFSYLAAVTRRLEFVSGIIILPQRQTVLVAKQAAALDVLSGGRLRLGMGLGWNAVEYEALGEDFSNRGQRMEEQFAVLRALWTQDLVTFRGRWHQIDDAGLNPLPQQRPIPLWIGGFADRALRRTAELADGWLLVRPPYPALEEQWARLRQYARQAGRDPDSVGLEGGIRYAGGSPEQWRRDADTWRRLGATYAGVNTMGAGLASPDEHIRALERVKTAVEA